MYPCCALDPGMFAYIAEQDIDVSDEAINQILAVASVGAWALLVAFMATVA